MLCGDLLLLVTAVTDKQGHDASESCRAEHLMWEDCTYVGVSVYTGCTSYLELYAQSIVRTVTKSRTTSSSVIGFEVLLRLIKPSSIRVSPQNLVARMEHQQTIEQLDRVVLETVVCYLSHSSTKIPLDLRVFINLSGQSLSSPIFLAFAEQLLLSHPSTTARLCIEITESAKVHNLNCLAHFIRTLQQRGCYFALDDFGSGFSSFSYLKALPVNYLKIDGSFVRGITKGSDDFAIVRGIHEIAQAMGKTTIAESVEDEKIMHCLQEIGIDLMQGNFLARPRPIEKLFSFGCCELA